MIFCLRVVLSNDTPKDAIVKSQNALKSTANASKQVSLATSIVNVLIVKTSRDAMRGGVS